MPLTLEQLRKEVLALPAEQREQLIASLSEGQEVVPLNLHADWRAELDYRMEEFRAGRMETIPWEIVEKELDGLDDLP